MKDRTWESFFIIPQKLFSFHVSRPVLLLRGLILFVLGLLGLYDPLFILKAVTRGIGGILLLFAVASFLMAWRSGRGSAALLTLFVLLGAVGVALLINPLFFDKILMVVFGFWLLFTGVWGILSVQKRFGQLALPPASLVAALIGIVLIIAPFRGAEAVSWTAALLMLLSGVQMILLAIGLDAGKWVIPAGKHNGKR